MTAATLSISVAEPPASWLVRPSVVVDGAVLAADACREASLPLAERHLEGKTLHAPRLLDHELTSVAMDLLTDIAFHRASPDTVVPLADAYALSASDADCLALAAQLRVPLVTFDQRLGKAAVAHLRSLE